MQSQATANQAVARTNEMRRRRRRIDLYPYLLVSPAMLFILIVTVYPSLYAIRLSTFDANLLRFAASEFVGLDNYVAAFSDEIFLTSVLRTVRWIVVIITVVALIKLIMGLVQNSAYDALTARIMKFFSIGIDIQWLIGIILIIIYGTTISFGVRHIWEHAAVMTVAVILGHLPARWKNADDRTRYRNSLLIVIVVLALVFVGVALLPQGWRVLPA